MLHWKVVRAAEDPALARGEAPAGFLSSAELEVLAGLRFGRRRRKWLLGRWAAKQLLAKLLEVEPVAITISNEASGAPFASGDGARLPLSISISHRDALAAVAVTEPDVSVGIDLELVVERSESLARTFFTAAEQARLSAAFARDAREGQLTLARTWSAKEAVLKALGLGLRRDTRGIDVGLPGVAGSDPIVAPGFAPLSVELRGALAGEVEGELRVGWRDEGAHVLTLATLC